MSDSVGSVSVDVVPDARGWAEKLRAQIRDQTVKVQAEADTAEANAELDKTARTRTARVRVNVDKNHIAEGASALDKFVGSLGLLPTLAITAGAALVPLAGTLGGIAATLAAPLAIAAGGATLFAFLGGAAVKQTIEQSKNVDKLRAAVDSAKTSLENARRSAGKNASTSASVAAAQERLNKATAEYQTALKGVSPQQREFISALDGLKSTFSGIISGPTGRSLLEPFTQGLGLLTYILRGAGPVIRASAGAFADLLGNLQQAVNSPGFERFMQLLSRQVGRDIEAFGHIVGNLARGLGGLFLVLDKKAGGGMLDALVNLTDRFSNWSSSERGRQALQGFIEYFHKVGPQVGDTIAAVARAIGHIVEALAPLGPPVLHIIQGIADAISNIPVPVLTALAAAAGSLVAFQKLGGFKATSALAGLVGGKGGLSGGVGGVIGSAKPVPVFVTNPGFGGGTGGGLPGKVGKFAPLAAGGEPAAIALGGGLAFAIMAYATYQIGKHIAGPDVKSAAQSTFASTGSVGGDGPRTAFTHINAPNSGGLTVQQYERQLSASGRASTAALDSLKAHAAAASRQIDQIGPRAADSLHAAIKTVGVLSASPTTGMDGLRARAAEASRSLDQIGPHTVHAAADAAKAVVNLNNKIQSIHDKKITIIANTQSAIASLERLQAFRLKDKYLTVYQRYQRVEQAVGPGGGAGRHATGGLISGPGTGSSDSIPAWLSNGEFVVNARAAAQNRALLDQINSGRRATYSPAPAGVGGGGMPSHISLVVEDGTTLRAYVQGHADTVYRANRNYEDMAAGR